MVVYVVRPQAVVRQTAAKGACDMAGLQPGDKVEWRAGSTPSVSHMRQGVIKEILPSGIALVRVKAQGETIVEEIRTARMRKVELPAPVKEKVGERKSRKASAKRGKAAKKKATAEA